MQILFVSESDLADMVRYVAEMDIFQVLKVWPIWMCPSLYVTELDLADMVCTAADMDSCGQYGL